MANLFGQLRDFFRAPKLDVALRELAPKQVTPSLRTSWVFDSHVMTEASGSRSSSKNPQAVSLAWDEDRWNIDSSAKNSWTGLTHRERKETLLQIFLTNPWASNCIDTIALYIISGGMTIEPRVPNPDKSQRKKIEQLLLRINEDWDFNQYVYDMLTDEMIFGETFGEYTMAGGVPYQLFSIDCLTMDTEHDMYGRALRYKQQLSSTSKVNYLKTDNIIRWWNPHKRAKVDPFSPLERVQDAILLDKKMVNWQTTFFQKGAKFPYSIEFQGDRDEADRFLTWFKQNFTGEKNAHLPPVTYNGAKLNPTGKGSIDIDFDRGLDRQQTIVLSAFHVPPSIACIAESGNRLTDMSDGQRKILQYIACDPRRHQFFEKFNYRLIRPYFGEDYYVSTRYADFRSEEDLAKVQDMRIRNGSLLIDEVRQEIGKEAYVKGGDVPVIVTSKEVTPIPRLDDLEDEQRTTAKQALDAGDLNNQMLAAKVEQAKNPPPPPPMLPPGQQNQGANNANPQPKTTTKSANSAKQAVGNRKTAKESAVQAGDAQEGSRWSLFESVEFTDRYQALGIPYPDPETMCPGECEGTGFIPVHKDEQEEPWHTLYLQAEKENPNEPGDNWHFVKCPLCNGTGKKQAKQESASHNTGMMLAFMLDEPTAKQLALPGGEPASQLHLTLAYLGDMEDEIPDDGKLRPHTSPERLITLLNEFTQQEEPPLAGTTGGIARFVNPGTDVDPVVSLVNIPGLAMWRNFLVRQVESAGYFVAKNFDYLPHITLSYIPPDAPMPIESLEPVVLSFDTICLVIGDERFFFKMGTGQISQPSDERENELF